MLNSLGVKSIDTFCLQYSQFKKATYGLGVMRAIGF